MGKLPGIINRFIYGTATRNSCRRHPSLCVDETPLTMAAITSPIRYSLLICVIAITWLPIASQAEGPREDQVKAAFFYHFANFVEWPETTFNTTNGQLRICVLGDTRFDQSLETTLSHKKIGDHLFEIRRNPPNAEIQHCHMLYVSNSVKAPIQTILRNIDQKDVLTVGETLDFIKHGGMVHFFVEKQKMRFVINTHAIKHSNLKVSSKLLRLAKTYSP